MDVTHIRGMLLEEAVLYLLGQAGYRTINSHIGDSTLASHSAGVAVVGRGAPHQVDAIADYLLGQPFSHPQRLLVEAKCYSNDTPIGISVVRNAVGVLKDVSEFWNTAGGAHLGHKRYHYHKAIFSVSRFASDAEMYAFAQDVYLFPLSASSCFQPIIDAIFGVTRHTLQRPAWPKGARLTELRLAIRDALQNQVGVERSVVGEEYGHEFQSFVAAVRSLGGVLLAIVGRTFPLFLVPSSRGTLDQLDDRVFVRVRTTTARRASRDGLRRQGWTLTDQNNKVLFSFDIPPTLFSMYGAAGVMTREAAALMKEEVFSELQAITFRNGRMRLIQFELDPNWLATLLDYTRTVSAQRREIDSAGTVVE